MTSLIDPNLAEIARLDTELAKAREQLTAMRVCIVYARDRRGHQFDFDTWIRLVEHALENGKLPPHAIEDAQAEAMTFWDALQAVRRQRDQLLRELAEQYPVAMAARDANEQGLFPDEFVGAVQSVIEKIRNSTEAAKLEYLPTRLRGGQ